MMKDPPHPGQFIREEILEPRGLTIALAASLLGVSRPDLSDILDGRTGLTGEVAARIEQAFGVKMETLMRMQTAHGHA